MSREKKGGERGLSTLLSASLYSLASAPTATKFMLSLFKKLNRGVQFRKLSNLETGQTYRATDFQPVNTTYGQSITCVLDVHLTNEEDLKKLNDSADVYLTYGGIKPISNGKTAHMIEFSFGMLDRVGLNCQLLFVCHQHSIIMCIAFYPLDIR
ncbi:hypothetical protein PR048_023488 [Dryococelus australis]|uniref:Uncharacterized protein n=1 Tax=Dryococelus australis TaxID=614101 RepID=A0ABQ9GU84_9NEOP|nr:hypothetical protein PR048_023488 [Dryococelus australis]